MEAAVAIARDEHAAGGDLTRPIDLVHLARMTLGDRGIEREVLQLFARQSTMLMARIQATDRTAISGLAHTLKGSAKGVGAWRVAAAAEAVELAVSGYPLALEAATARLAETVREANAIIGDLLRAH